MISSPTCSPGVFFSPRDLRVVSGELPSCCPSPTCQWMAHSDLGVEVLPPSAFLAWETYQPQFFCFHSIWIKSMFHSYPRQHVLEQLCVACATPWFVTVLSYRLNPRNREACLVSWWDCCSFLIRHTAWHATSTIAAVRYCTSRSTQWTSGPVLKDDGRIRPNVTLLLYDTVTMTTWEGFVALERNRRTEDTVPPAMTVLGFLPSKEMYMNRKYYSDVWYARLRANYGPMRTRGERVMSAWKGW